MERTLAGKTALVTGGSRGLGQAIAEKLAVEGALVAVNYAENRAAADATVARVMAAELGPRGIMVNAGYAALDQSR